MSWGFVAAGAISAVGSVAAASVAGGARQTTTAEEKALARQAKADDERFTDLYMPLEMAEIDQYFDPSAQKFQKAVLDRQISADSAAAEAGAMRANIEAAQRSGTNLASGSNTTGVTDSATGAAVASGLGEVEAAGLAQDVRDQEGIGIVRTGRDVSRTTTNSLAQLARQSNFAAGAKLRARQQVSMARAKALGDVASAAVIGGFETRNQVNNMDPNAANPLARNIINRRITSGNVTAEQEATGNGLSGYSLRDGLFGN